MSYSRPGLEFALIMAKKRKSKDWKNKPAQSGSSMNYSSQNNSPSGWFAKHLSRRQLGKGLAWTAVLGMAGLTLYKIGGDDEPEIAEDSLDLQKKEGWNVGSTEKPLSFPSGVTPTDSVGKTWSAY